MTIQRQGRILGAAVPVSAAMARLSSAEEQASEAATGRRDSSSKADEQEAHASAMISGRTQPRRRERVLDAAAAWSVGGVVAHEYTGTFTKILAYAVASLVDISRIKAQKHFPSDVVVGTVIGNLVAQNIYSRHHDPELGGETWRSISQVFRADGTRSPANQGSPYVPLDSWIYPALDRLAAMGLIDSGFAGMRPWTRNECVRLLGEAGDRVESGVGGTEAEKIYNLLEAEFRSDRERIDSGGLLRAQIESIYGRMTEISGQPLTDGNHFGQTITNDFGRPYQEGFNFVGGVSAWMTSGRWATYARAEYQHSPSAP